VADNEAIVLSDDDAIIIAPHDIAALRARRLVNPETPPLLHPLLYLAVFSESVPQALVGFLLPCPLPALLPKPLAQVILSPARLLITPQLAA